MAGIEKVCELSSEYCGWNMYGYKHNLIQVHPRYREKFRGASHTLYINGTKKRLVYPGGFSSQAYNPDERLWYDPPFPDEKSFLEFMTKERKMRLVTETDFTLEVYDPELLGKVNGEYRNWTLDFQTTKRKLKRLLRCRELNIKTGTPAGT